jgi:hypothetical protein
MEKWKKIKDYEDAYMISNKGRIKCLVRNGNSKERIKSLSLHSSGTYLTVELRKNNKITRKFVHRLVALYFLPNPKKLPVVNHKDGNKLNNNVDNFEWCTHSENSKHAVRTGLTKISVGDNHYNTKIKNKDLKKIFKMREKGMLNKDIAKYFKVNPATISKILNGSRNASKL